MDAATILSKNIPKKPKMVLEIDNISKVYKTKAGKDEVLTIKPKTTIDIKTTLTFIICID